ncbi:hypothetical protein ACLMJK_007615 [Lecanora helva]
MEDATRSPPANNAVKTLSCERCAMRKVKCDKQQPCAGCVRHNAECEYRISRRPRRNRKQDRNDLLEKRLEQYERMLRQKTLGPDAPPEASHHNSPQIAAGSNSTTKDNSYLRSSNTTITQTPRPLPPIQLDNDEARAKYFDRGLWTKMVDDMSEPDEALGHTSDEADNENDAAQDTTDFLLGNVSMPTNLYNLHPSGSRMLELWQMFRENVDPLTKIVHAPSLQSAIQKAITDFGSITKGFEALLFAIYSVAVVSLKSNDCERRFGESRKSLLLRYRQATKAALSRAKFIGSANLTVLQAFFFHIISMREVYDSRTLWTLVGVALRMAEGMGLHRDGSHSGLPPFEAEMRRRVWWQLKILDGDSAELSGSDKFAGLGTDPRSTELPSDVNDCDLYPGMISISSRTDRITDMVFCAMRFDLRTYWITRHKQGKTDSIWSPHVAERDNAIDDFERLLETKYVRYCDPSQPIQLMATLTARAAVSTMRMIAHHPRRWTTEEQTSDTERQYVWDLSIKGLKQYNMIHTSRELERFSWHAPFYFRWPAIIHILYTLKADPLLPDASQAWDVIDEVYQTNPDFVANTNKRLYVAIGNLCLGAYKAREIALEQQGRPIATAPQYIKTLGDQRKAANARRREREATAKRKQIGMQELPYTPQSMSDNQASPHPVQSPRDQLLQDANSYQLAPPSANNNSAFLSSHQGVQQSDKLFESTEDYAQMVNLDLMLTQVANWEDPNNQDIDWTQWDALLSDF